MGIKVTVVPVASLGKTLSSGNYDMIIFAWIGTSFPFAGAQQLWASTSDSNYGHWVNAESDTDLKNAASETDANKAVDELNQADQIMSNDATSTGPPYNIQEWGIRAS